MGNAYLQNGLNSQNEVLQWFEILDSIYLEIRVSNPSWNKGRIELVWKFKSIGNITFLITYSLAPNTSASYNQCAFLSNATWGCQEPTLQRKAPVLSVFHFIKPGQICPAVSWKDLLRRWCVHIWIAVVRTSEAQNVFENQSWETNQIQLLYTAKITSKPVFAHNIHPTIPNSSGSREKTKSERRVGWGVCFWCNEHVSQRGINVFFFFFFIWQFRKDKFCLWLVAFWLIMLILLTGTFPFNFSHTLHSCSDTWSFTTLILQVGTNVRNSAIILFCRKLATGSSQFCQEWVGWLFECDLEGTNTYIHNLNPQQVESREIVLKARKPFFSQSKAGRSPKFVGFQHAKIVANSQR